MTNENNTLINSDRELENPIPSQPFNMQSQKMPKHMFSNQRGGEQTNPRPVTEPLHATPRPTVSAPVENNGSSIKYGPSYGNATLKPGRVDNFEKRRGVEVTYKTRQPAKAYGLVPYETKPNHYSGDDQLITQSWNDNRKSGIGKKGLVWSVMAIAAIVAFASAVASGPKEAGEQAHQQVDLSQVESYSRGEVEEFRLDLSADNYEAMGMLVNYIVGGKAGINFEFPEGENPINLLDEATGKLMEMTGINEDGISLFAAYDETRLDDNGNRITQAILRYDDEAFYRLISAVGEDFDTIIFDRENSASYIPRFGSKDENGNFVPVESLSNVATR